MIEVRQLTKRFGDFAAVRDVSFRVEPGEIFALLGPNGSGKTTTLKCMVGLAPPSSGQVLIGGIDSWRRAREARRLLSYLPQRIAFHENLTAREVLEFYCRLRKLPRERVERALERSSFAFNGFADRLVGEFSGGMVQRLAVAVAILPDAPALVLDEPTLSLDPEGTIRFRELIRSLKQEGKTVVFSSHILSDVELLADRVGLLVGGRLVAVESVERLTNGLAAGSRLRLLLRNPAERFVALARERGATGAALAGDRLTVSCRPESRLVILRALEDAGAIIERFSTEEPSLEEIYLRYVNEANPADRAAGGTRLPDQAAPAG